MDNRARNTGTYTPMKILPYILHPVRAFKHGLTTNPLSRWTWGIEPENIERKIRARRLVIIPVTLYAVTVLGPLFLVLIANQSTSMNFSIPALTMICSLPSIGLLIVYFISTSFVKLDKFPGDESYWHEFILAGIPGKQIIFGKNTSRLVGFSIGAVLHVITCLYICLISFLLDVRIPLFHVMFSTAFGMALLFIVWLETSLEVLISSFVIRFVYLLVITILTSPGIMFFITFNMFNFTVQILFPGSNLQWVEYAFAMLMIELFSWPIRIFIIYRYWCKAMQKLEDIQVSIKSP